MLTFFWPLLYVAIFDVYTCIEVYTIPCEVVAPPQKELTGIV